VRRHAEIERAKRQDRWQRHDPVAAGIDAKLEQHKRCRRLGIPAMSRAHTDDSITLERPE